jgi:uncharacterized membrane protein
MATADHIRNPIEWSVDQIKNADVAVERAAHGLVGSEAARHAAPPVVRRIGTDDIKDALAKGLGDFAAYRTDVIFLCIIYPLAGAILARFAFGYGMLPMIFPLASGFALLGPVAAIGLYEMSRRREQGHEVGWGDAFGVVKAPAFGAIFVLGLLLLAIFLIWLGVALGISAATIGTERPASIGAFVRDVLGTGPGWAMIVVGIGVGFCFAVLVMAISVVSFPLLLDRDVGLGTAIATSVRVVRTNPGPMALWGLIVALGLVIGAIPLLIGLVVVMPVLGHATWHLYRKVVAG